MSNGRTHVLASILVAFWPGLYSQALPVNDQASCTIACRVLSSPDYEYQSAVADEDSDDPPDDLLLLRGTLNLLPSAAAAGSRQGHAAAIGPPQHSTSATLASQHILLRL
jgi:hypothetical protein